MKQCAAKDMGGTATKAIRVAAIKAYTLNKVTVEAEYRA